MIIKGPENTPGQELENSHGGKGTYFVRTLFDHEFSSSLKYVRDFVLHGHSSIGEHLHTDDEELYMVISGSGIIQVDDQKRRIGPGVAVLTKSGSTHSLMNENEDDLRIVVVCAKMTK